MRRQKIPRQFPHATRKLIFSLLIANSVATVALLATCRYADELPNALHNVWRHAVGDFVNVRSRYCETPENQLDQWMRDAREVLSEHPDDASLHLAAAIAMRAASTDFLQDYRATRSFRSHASRPHDLFDRLKSAVKEEHVRFRWHCANEATRLAGDDRELWRVRALLLFPRYPVGYQMPVDPDWQKILQQAMEVDPGNGLYHFLIANKLLGEVIECHDDATITFHHDRLELALPHVRKAIASDGIQIGNSGCEALSRLMDAGSYGRAYRTRMLVECDHVREASHLCVNAGRNLGSIVSELQAPEHAIEAEELRELQLQLYETIANSGFEYNEGKVRLRHEIAIASLLARRANAKAGSKQPLPNELRNLFVDNGAYELACAVLNVPSPTVGAATYLIPFSVTLGRAAFVSLIICLICVRFCKPRADRYEIPIVATVILVACFAVCFFLYALVPAREASRVSGNWCFTACVYGMPIAVVAIAISRYSKHSQHARLRFTIRSILGISMLVALLCAIVVNGNLTWQVLGMPIEFHIPSYHTPQYGVPYSGTGMPHHGLQRNLLDFWYLNDGCFMTCKFFVAAIMIWTIACTDKRRAVAQYTTLSAVAFLLLTLVCLVSTLSEIHTWRPYTRHLHEYSQSRDTMRKRYADYMETVKSNPVVCESFVASAITKHELSDLFISARQSRAQASPKPAAAD